MASASVQADAALWGRRRPRMCRARGPGGRASYRRATTTAARRVATRGARGRRCPRSIAPPLACAAVGRPTNHRQLRLPLYQPSFPPRPLPADLRSLPTAPPRRSVPPAAAPRCLHGASRQRSGADSAFPRKRRNPLPLQKKKRRFQSQELVKRKPRSCGGSIYLQYEEKYLDACGAALINTHHGLYMMYKSFNDKC